MASQLARRGPEPHAIRPAALPDIGPLDLYDAILVEARSENTRLSRIHDVRVFCEFLREPDPATACALFVARGRGKCNAIGMAFRSWMIQTRGNSPQTVNRRLSMLRTLVKLGRRLDMIDWVCDIPRLPEAGPSRDCRGPDESQWRQFWAYLLKRGDGPVATRDRAMYATMFDCALRVAELVNLDLADVDLASAQIWVKSKGRLGTKEWRTIAPRDVELIRQFLVCRGDLPGALFCSHPERTRKPTPALVIRMKAMHDEGMTWEAVAELLNAEGCKRPSGKPWDGKYAEKKVRKGITIIRRIPERRVRYMLESLSKAAGLDRPIRPHGVRHSAITRALDITSGNIRDVQKYARHSNIQTTAGYDDRRTDPSPDITRRLGEDV